MIPWLGKRLGQLALVLWGVGSLVFLLLHVVPGDPVDVILGESALPAQREDLRERLHLNEPLAKQYTEFWQSALRGRFGESLIQHRNVGELIRERLPATLELALLALLASSLISIPLGLWAAIRQNTWSEHLVLFLSLLGASVPSFWLGPLLMLFFAAKLGWLPVSERGDWSSYILPVSTLALALSAFLVRITRASCLEVLHQDYITTAHSKGLPPWKVYAKHALKNALLPVVSVLGLQLGALLSGAVIIETIFDWPGLGELLYRAIQSRDFPLVQGCVFVVAFFYVFASTLVDLVYTWLNPKLELS